MILIKIQKKNYDNFFNLIFRNNLKFIIIYKIYQYIWAFKLYSLMITVKLGKIKF